MIENINDVTGQLFRFSNDFLEHTVRIDFLLTCYQFVTIFMQSPEYAFNPHLRYRLPTIKVALGVSKVSGRLFYKKYRQPWLHLYISFVNPKIERIWVLFWKRAVPLANIVLLMDKEVPCYQWPVKFVIKRLTTFRIKKDSPDQ